MAWIVLIGGVDLSEFPATLTPIILHFVNYIGDEKHCMEAPVACSSLRRFPLLRLFGNRHGLVTVDLLDNFMNILKLPGYGERFHVIAMLGNGWGKERKTNGKPATLILVADEEEGLKQNLRQMNGSLNYILFMETLCAP